MTTATLVATPDPDPEPAAPSVPLRLLDLERALEHTAAAADALAAALDPLEAPDA